MKHERISMKSLSDTIGISVVTIRKALRKLEEAETVTVLKEKRVYQHEGGYRTESRRYLVSHPRGDARCSSIRVTLQNLMHNFDHCYHETICTLLPQSVVKQHFLTVEWQEHMNWLEGFMNMEEQLEGKCIDQENAGRVLNHPNFGKLIVYEHRGNILYPACECARILGLKNPSVVGSRCPSKELWHIRLPRKRLPNGSISYQLLDRNLICAADIRRLTALSADDRRREKYEWMTSLETTAQLNEI